MNASKVQMIRPSKVVTLGCPSSLQCGQHLAVFCQGSLLISWMQCQYPLYDACPLSGGASLLPLYFLSDMLMCLNGERVLWCNS